MKGLLVKDFHMLGQQKKLLAIYIVLAVFLGYSMESSFVVGYFPMIAVLLAITTISSDNFDNGMAFLMAMPGARKNYAKEKFLLSFIIVAVSWVFALVVQFASLMVRKESFDALDFLEQDLLYIPIFLLVCSVMIPIMLKFGADKGRLVLFAIFGIVALVIIFGSKIADSLGSSVGFDAKAFISKIEQMSAVTIAGIVGAIAVVIMLVSLLISSGIMKRKEF